MLQARTAPRNWGHNQKIPGNSPQTQDGLRGILSFLNVNVNVSVLTLHAQCSQRWHDMFVEQPGRRVHFASFIGC